MAIVGTAFVRLRVIGDRLGKEIGKQVKQAVDQSSPQLDKAGDEAGEKISKSVGESIQEGIGSQMGRVADEIGEALGNAMGAALGRSLRRRVGARVSEGISGARSQIRGAADKVQGVWDEIGEVWGNRTKMSLRKTLTGLLSSAIGGLITAGPSVLAFGGAIGGAVAASVIPAIAAIGPAAAGAGLAVVAAFASIKISAGLLGLALKYPSDALTDFQERAETFKGLIARPVQAGLLSGLNASMRLLTPAAKALEPALARIGVAAGDVAIGFADAVRQGAMMERINAILAAQEGFIRNAGGGISAFGQAFIIVLNALRPVIDFLGVLIRDMGQWALTAAQAGEASGALGEAVTRWFDALRRFIGVLVDFGVGIYNVFAAALPVGQSMFTTLENTGAAFRAWTGDTANQERMTRFFENMRRISSEVYAVLRDIGAAGLGALEDTNVDSVLQGLSTLRSLGAPIAQIFRSIQDAAGPQLTEAFQSFADLITELANSGVIGILASAFSHLFAALTFILQIPGIGSLLALIAGFAALSTSATMLWGILSRLGPVFNILRIVLVAVAGVIGWIPTVIAVLVGALVWFFTQTETGRAIIEAVWNAIVAAFQWAVDTIGGILQWLWGIIQNVWTFIQTAAQGIWSAITTAFTAVVSAVTTALNAVWAVVTTVWNAVWGFLQPIITGIWNFIQTAFSAIQSVIETILGAIHEVWIRVWPLLALPIRVLYGVILAVWNAIYAFLSGIVTAIWDFVSMTWNNMVGAITLALDVIWGAITSVWNAIWGFLQPIIQAIWGFISNAWNAIVGMLQRNLAIIWGVITSVWNAVAGFIGGVLGGIASFISGIWNGIVNTVQRNLGIIWGVIQNVWNNITGFIRGAMSLIGDLVGSVWDFLGNAGRGILNGIKAAVNVVIDAVNFVIEGINWAIDLANQLPGADIPTIPLIPRLAKGGTVMPTADGTLAIIGEAGRPERVEPLDSSGLSRRDRAMIAMLAGQGGRGGDVHVYIGNRELTEIVDEVVEDRENGLADRVLTGTKG